MDDREDELGCRALGIDGRADGTTLRRGLFFPNASRLPNHVGCRALEVAAMECFASNGWFFSNRIANV